jgi:hypothetical protein
LGILGNIHRSTQFKRVLGAVVVGLMPCSALAGDVTVPPKAPLRTALAEVRTRDVTPPPRSAPVARRSDQSANPATESASFFKSKTGVLVLAAFGIGAGYALYSTKHDRIHSPGKN